MFGTKWLGRVAEVPQRLVCQGLRSGHRGARRPLRGRAAAHERAVPGSHGEERIFGAFRPRNDFETT